MKGVMKRLINLGFTLELGADAKDFIADKGYDIQFGARPLHRAIQKYLEDPLAEEIINSHLHEGDKIKIDIKEGAEELTVKIEKGKATKAKSKE